jgi:arsenate reductase
MVQESRLGSVAQSRRHNFRKLPDKDKNGLDPKKAMALMLAQPSMIKRPVLDLGRGKLLVGFAPDSYSAEIASR